MNMDDMIVKIIITTLIFILGAGMGSFVTMLVWRLKTKKSLMGRSVCEKCGKTLSPSELIPVISWFRLRGRCGKCHKKLDKFIPFVELLTAILFGISFWFWFGELNNILGVIQFSLWLVVLTGLIALAVYDMRYRKLPNKVMFSTIVVAAIFYIITSVFIEQNSYSLATLNAIFAMLPITGVYGLIYILTRGKMVGFGDVKLGLIIGFLLPWQGGLAVLFLANILGFIIILPKLIMGKIKPDARVSFGPYLIVATITAFFMMETFMNLF